MGGQGGCLGATAAPSAEGQVAEEDVLRAESSESEALPKQTHDARLVVPVVERDEFEQFAGKGEADLITYLCRAESGYITGVTYDVNGGAHMH